MMHLVNDPKIYLIIDEDHVRNVCKIRQEGCCRYLTLSVKGFNCEKHTELSEYLDNRVTEGSMNATGDNCPGIF